MASKEDVKEQILGQLLKESMETAGLSQRQLAKKLTPPRAQNYVYRAIKAERKLSVFEIFNWCDVCGVSALALIEKLYKLPKPNKTSKL